MVFRQTAEAAEAEVAALANLLISGSIKLYSGTRPATPATALSGNTLLATWTFDATPWTAGASDGVYTWADAPQSVAPAASGTATFARLFKSDGTTAVCDVDAGTSGTEIILGSTTITTGVNVSLTAFTLTVPLV